MSNQYRWQVPGNGNPFDSTLENWNQGKMSQRSIGVLEYINKYKSISKHDFESKIKCYLKKTFHHEDNDSIPAHFYRPLEFIGLIRNYNNTLSLSIDGKNFLNSIIDNNFEKALDYYILQMLKTKYPNSATNRVSLPLFPFKIIFKLLLTYDSLPIDDFMYKIPYIQKVDNVINYKSFKKNNEKYEKWKTWVLSYLIKWNILNKENNNISISKYKKDYISKLLENTEYSDMFFNEEQYFNKMYYTKKIPRNSELVKKIIKKYDYKCFFDKTHITFPTNLYNNYVECHHIIPLSLSDSFTINLDCEDNLIPLCPNCDKAIHLASKIFKEPLLNHIYHSSHLTNTFKNITLDDLKEIYIL